MYNSNYYNIITLVTVLPKLLLGQFWKVKTPKKFVFCVFGSSMVGSLHWSSKICTYKGIPMSQKYRNLFNTIDQVAHGALAERCLR